MDVIFTPFMKKIKTFPGSYPWQAEFHLRGFLARSHVLGNRLDFSSISSSRHTMAGTGFILFPLGRWLSVSFWSKCAFCIPVPLPRAGEFHEA
jgi:hypothetical protein